MYIIPRSSTNLLKDPGLILGSRVNDQVNLFDRYSDHRALLRRQAYGCSILLVAVREVHDIAIVLENDPIGEVDEPRRQRQLNIM